jgi:predicted ATPase
VDASLATITEGPDGEPRVGMLETIRAYALDQLAATDDVDSVRDAHAEHYLGLAERLMQMAFLREPAKAHSLAELELDNFREALGWTLQPGGRGEPHADRLAVGLELAGTLHWLWSVDTRPRVEVGTNWPSNGQPVAHRPTSLAASGAWR